MRMMRLYSRITMVWKPIQRVVPTGGGSATDGEPAGGGPFTDEGAPGAIVRSATVPPMLVQPHEHFLEAIDLVAHRQHVEALRRQLREQAVEALFLGDLGFERVVVDARQLEAGDVRRGGE